MALARAFVDRRGGDQSGSSTETRSAPANRRLAAILAADVVGYSRLMGADEEGTLNRLMAHRRQLIGPKIEQHRGRIVKTTGDGMLVEFASVVDAVRCAVEVQRGIFARNAETPKDKRITFRIGVNLGDVIAEADDIYGDGVNIAARLEALAEPGGICISRTVRDHVGDRLPYAFDDMGERSVKNIVQPVHAYSMSAEAISATPLVAAQFRTDTSRHGTNLRTAISVAGRIGTAITGWWAWPKANPPVMTMPMTASLQSLPSDTANPVSHLSMVVLPFANLSSDPEQEYFVDAMTDDLTTDLSRISGSFVIARNTAFTYKGKPVDVKQLGRELGVRYVIEGSVRRAADQVLVNVQLIDAESGAHLWADRFETDRQNLATAQSEITGRLARTLNVEVTRAAGRRIERQGAVDLEARDIAIRAKGVYDGGLSKSITEAAGRLYEQALEKDPELLDAKIGLAFVWARNVVNGWSNSPKEDEAQAEKIIFEALEQRPNDASLHMAIGVLRRYQNRLAEARVELDTAIALDPNDTFAIRNLGTTLVQLGQPELAIPYFEKSIRLSPHDPFVAFNYSHLGRCYLFLGNVDKAIELLMKARALNPKLWFTYINLAAALGFRGDLQEAEAALEEAIRLKPYMNSLVAMRADIRRFKSPAYWAFVEKTVVVGLHRAGFPEE